MKRKLSIIAVLFIVLKSASAVSLQTDTIQVTVKTENLGLAVSPQMMGLSYETSLMRPGANGVRYFRPDNHALIKIFKTIGIKSLRIGGASVDSNKMPSPSEEDITSFFDFAKKAGVTVVYSIRGCESKDIKESDNVALASKAAKLIQTHYKNQLDLFAIGNEPYYWLRDQDKYVKKWKILRDAVLSGFPDAKFCAADEGPMPDLIYKMATAYGNPEGRLVTVSQHSYPFGSSYLNNIDPSDLVNRIPRDAAESRDKMLSFAAHKAYEKIYNDIMGAIKGTSLPYRITECNSFSSSGLLGASDSYASALWVLDYMYWWANHGVDGMNFHTGDRTGGDANFICRYAAFRTNDRGYDVHPLSYGMKLFGMGGNGKLLLATVEATPEQNLVSYATISKGKTVAVTLINKAYGNEAKEQLVKVKLDKSLKGSKVQIIYLLGRNNDVSGDMKDVTLGGQSIQSDGSWSGNWNELPASSISKNEMSVKMPPASAAILKFSVK